MICCLLNLLSPNFLQHYHTFFPFQGFISLPQDDQLILIKTGFFEIWAVYVAPMTTKDTLTLSDGLTLNRKHLDVVYEVRNCLIPNNAPI